MADQRFCWEFMTRRVLTRCHWHDSFADAMGGNLLDLCFPWLSAPFGRHGLGTVRIQIIVNRCFAYSGFFSLGEYTDPTPPKSSCASKKFESAQSQAKVLDESIRFLGLKSWIGWTWCRYDHVSVYGFSQPSTRQRGALDRAYQRYSGQTSCLLTAAQFHGCP